MTLSMAFGPLLTAAILGGGSEAPADWVAMRSPSGPNPPMTPFADDPSSGGVRVRVGSGVEDQWKRRAFLTDAAGNLDVAVQFQIKLPERYGPGGEIYRVVVQAIRLSGSGGMTFDFEEAFEPFPVVAGGHVNEVIAVKIPPPSPGDSEWGAVRVVVEELQDDGGWESRSVQTVNLMPD